MINFFNALLPVIVIVGLGRFLAWKAVIPDSGFRSVERLCFVLLLPVMVVGVLAEADFDDAPWRMAVALLGAQAVVVASSVIAPLWKKTTRPAIGCIIQSNARWNALIGLSIAGSLYGEAGLALVAITAAVLIPTANMITVTGFSIYGDIGDKPKRNPLIELIRNPIVIGCIIGGLLNVLNMPPSGVVKTTMNILADGAIALGLLAAGAAVDIAALKRAGARTFFWAGWRLVSYPAVAGGLGWVLGASPMTIMVMVICTATPTATSGYILAKEMGGDAPFMANLVAVQTVLAIITMPIIFLIAQSLVG